VTTSPDAPSLSRPGRGVRLGLRVQIVLALAGVILIAYVPLFFAIAQVTRATSLAYREDAALGLGRAVAAHAGDVLRDRPGDLDRTLGEHVGDAGARAVGVYGPEGQLVASAGDPEELSGMAAPSPPYTSRSARAAAARGHALDIVVPVHGGAVVVRVPVDEDAARTAQVVRGVGLYMGVFALALLVFAYIALTRAIVRPIEELARAADRVASGSRALEMPRKGASEISDLGASVRSMADRLLAEEKALRAKVDELTTTTRRLTETREQLAGSERLASVGRLAAGVAHEIGNPIAAIMGMHDLLEDDEIPTHTRADFLRRMRKETERINVVVRDLLDFARPETGAPEGHVARASVAEAAADAAGLVRPQKEWRSIDTKLELEGDLHVALSAQRLTQVLLNLLLNAGAALASCPGQRTVTIRAGRAEERVRIEVEDDGPGVPPDLRARIFDPFVTTKEVGAGTGLGLAVCRGIVEGAGGRIELDASYVGGARFVMDLPSG
jgi:two-component system, NtrC family, sensor kinase